MALKAGVGIRQWILGPRLDARQLAGELGCPGQRIARISACAGKPGTDAGARALVLNEARDSLQPQADEAFTNLPPESARERDWLSARTGRRGCRLSPAGDSNDDQKYSVISSMR